MLIGVIADDFTGASDIANTLAKGVGPGNGLRTAQFAGVPSSDAPNDIDKELFSAVCAAEELEETAKLLVALRGQSTCLLTDAQVEELESTFGRI